MAQNIIVLGAGIVGSAIAVDLSRGGYDVTSVDLNDDALQQLKHKHALSVECADFTNPEVLEKLLLGKDLVIGAAPGAFGFELMRNVILNKKDMVDISFCPEDYLELDQLAKENDVTVVGDMGVAPGMCNAILGYHDSMMKVDSYKCIVGGLPDTRTWPLEYKSSWSPIDCIEEYVRPARIMREGKVISRPALSDAELVEFDEVGTLEEWNSDGLRSLLTTMGHIPNMVEKTLRYPGTINYLKALRDIGYFSYDEIEVKGHKVKPIDLTAELLFPKWKLNPGEGEYTIMRISISGTLKGAEKKLQYDLYDRYDSESDTLSMSRTTGYTCAGVGEMLLKNMIQEKGVLAPENVGANEANFHYLLSYLGDRNVDYRISEK